MTALSEEDIRSYVASGEPMDKAGAYAIQGIASRWIPRIEGDYFNVVGLPVSLVYRMLQEHESGREVRYARASERQWRELIKSSYPDPDRHLSGRL